MRLTDVPVRVDGSGLWPVAHLRGDIDLSNVESIGLAVESAVSNAAFGLVLDLSDVTYLDSSGLRLIFRLIRELQDRQQQLRLVVPRGARTWSVLQLAGVPQVANIYAELPDALPRNGDRRDRHPSG